jgi:TRAP-type C4-dicarboxylate transport system substrate-binding protein
LGVAVKLFEVTEYLNLTNLGHNCGIPTVMNLDTWKKLPEDVKKVIEDIGKEEVIDKFVEIERVTHEYQLKIAKDQGIKILEFPASEVEKLTQVARDQVWQGYAKRLSQKGLDGNRILEEYLKSVETYSSVP